MILRIILIFNIILVFLLSGKSFGQEKNVVKDYRTLDQGLKFPEETTCLKFFSDSLSLNRFLNSPIPFSKLESIIIVGDLNDKQANALFSKLSEIAGLIEIKISSSNFKSPKVLSLIKNLQKLSIIGCPNLNYDVLFEHLSNLNSLKYLCLENNELNKLPKNIEKLNQVTTLRIASNSLLNFNNAIKSICKMPALIELQLPMNDLTEISSQTAKLEQLESLDLTSNNVTGLPEELSSLKKLKSLKLEGNYIVDLALELEKIKNPNLKLLTLDKSLTPESLSKLKKLFPAAQIREVDTFNDSEFVYSAEEDSLNSNAMYSEKLEKIIQKIDTGTIKVYRNEIKALSNAYLFYPQLFSSHKFSYDFDSLIFDVRYADNSYSNVWKIQPNQKYPNIVLEMYAEKPKGEVWFDFNRATEVNRSLIKSNPEVNAFIGMKWVYLGAMNPKEFKNAYVKNELWSDVRIYYNEPKKNFTIELKNKKGFTSFQAYPRITDLRSSVETSQRMYAKRQERYLKVLQRREDKFHANLFREKVRYDRLFREREAKTWDVFRMQMSEKEKAMTNQQWLAYYDEIMREEKKALYSSAANATNLTRSLELEGYQIISSVDQAMNNSVKEFLSVFLDENNKKLADAKVFLIAPGKKEVYVNQGNMGAKETPLFFDFSSNYKIVVENRSGHLSISTEKDLQKVDFTKKSIVISTKTFDKNLTSIGQIRRELKLE